MDVNINSSSPMYHVPEGVSVKEADSGAAKIYLLLLTYDVSEEDGDFNQRWEFVKGREAAYNRIKEEIIYSFEKTNHPLIIDESFIAVDTMKMKITDSKPIHKFMKDVIERGQIVDNSGFNIDDYFSIESAENTSEPEELRYGQGEQNIPYDQTNAIDGGEV